MPAFVDLFSRHRRAVIAAVVATSIAIVAAVAIATSGAPDAPVVDAGAAERPVTTPPTGAITTPTAPSTTAVTTSVTTTTSTTSPSATTTAATTSTTSTMVAEDRLPTLSEGAIGNEVAALQRMLNIVTGSSVAVDGVYGPATTLAVTNFQAFMGLPATGEADHDTRLILFYMDEGRSNTLPTWPIPTIGDGGADGCQVTVIGDSLMVSAMRQQEQRLAELGCASAADAVGGRSLADGWQCRVIQPNGSRRLLFMLEPEPGNDTCAPSGLKLLRLWADARALGDLVVVALGTNDAGLYAETRWIEHWRQALAIADERPVVFLTTRARPGSNQTVKQDTYSDALRRFCITEPRCVLAEWAFTPTALDAASYVDSVHLTAIATRARSAFIRDVVGALITDQPIPNPRPVPTPIVTLPTTTTTTSTTSTTSTTVAPTTTTSSTPTTTSTTSTTSTTAAPTTTTSTSTTTTTTTTTSTTLPGGSAPGAG